MGEDTIDAGEVLAPPVVDETPRYSVDAAGNYAVWIGQPVPDGFTEVPERPSVDAIWRDGAWH